MKVTRTENPPPKRGYRGKYYAIYKELDALAVGKTLEITITARQFDSLRSNVYRHADESGYSVQTIRDENTLYITKGETK